MGRKSKLTPKVRDTIVAALEAGNYDETAYTAAGISHESFYGWLRDGQREGSGVKFDFFEAVTRARGVAEQNAVQGIVDAGHEDWRAMAWFLERRHSRKWANTQRIEMQVEKEFEQMLGVLEDGLEPEEFRKVAGLLAGSEEEARI